MSEGELLELVHRAIGSPIYGNIEWQLQAEIRIHCDPQLQDIKPPQVRAFLRQFVVQGNSLEIRRETREWH